MPMFPPSIDWNKFDDAKMKGMSDAIRSAMLTGSDFLNTGASYLHPQMVNAMRKYGLDGTNRFGFGSDANRAANKVTNLLKRSAEHMADAASCMGFAYLAFMTDVWVPIQRAKEEMKNGASDTLNV
jgi:hypothetical protein